MFEQLDDEYFDEFYSRKSKKTEKQHEIINIAVLSLSSNEIENCSNIIFSRYKIDGLIFDKAVIGFEGVDCFLLTCQKHSQIMSETYIQCSTLVDSKKMEKIIKFVLSKLNLNYCKLSWINKRIVY